MVNKGSTRPPCRPAILPSLFRPSIEVPASLASNLHVSAAAGRKSHDEADRARRIGGLGPRRGGNREARRSDDEGAEKQPTRAESGCDRAAGVTCRYFNERQGSKVTSCRGLTSSKHVMFKARCAITLGPQNVARARPRQWHRGHAERQLGFYQQLIDVLRRGPCSA